MINVEMYTARLKDLLLRQFGSRLVYMGLQGSYLRGEATENSDLDIMIVIDGLNVSDLEAYRAIVESLDHAEKSCGFICSKADLANWNPLEIWTLLNGTKDLYGDLCSLVPPYAQQDIRNFAKMSLNNLYHGLCHQYIHAPRSECEAALPGTYKGAFFILQTLYYLNHGEYIATKARLLPLLEGIDHTILTRAMELNSGMEHDFSDSFELIFKWCQDSLRALS